MKTLGIVGTTLAGVLIAATAVVSGVTLVNSLGSSPVAAVAAVATPVLTMTVHAKPTARNRSSTKVIVVPTAPAAPAAPASLPAATLIDCGDSVYAGPNTSCSFALNVAAGYSGSGADYAFSPVTGLSYTMNCGGSFPTVCTGGNGAVVEFVS